MDRGSGPGDPDCHTLPVEARGGLRIRLHMTIGFFSELLTSGPTHEGTTCEQRGGCVAALKRIRRASIYPDYTCCALLMFHEGHVPLFQGTKRVQKSGTNVALPVPMRPQEPVEVPNCCQLASLPPVP